MDCRIQTRGTEYSTSRFFPFFSSVVFRFFYVFFIRFTWAVGFYSRVYVMYTYIYIHLNVLLYIIFISFTTSRWIAADDATKRLQEWKPKKKTKTHIYIYYLPPILPIVPKYIIKYI